MFKRGISIIAAVCLSLAVVTNVALAYPNSSYSQGEHSQQQNNGKGQNQGQANKEENKNKSYMNQLKSIDKRLTKIEEMIVRYELKFSKMERDDDDDEDKTAVEEKTDGKPTEEKPAVNEEDTDEESNVHEEKSSDSSTTSETKLVKESDMPNSTDMEPIEGSNEKAQDDEEEEDALEEAEEAAEEAKEEEEEAAEEAEEQAEEEAEEAEERAEDIAEELEDAIKEQSDYNGKMKSLENQLNSVEKKLEQLAANGADSSLIAERRDRIAAVKLKIAESAAEIGQIQEKVIEKIQNDTNVEERATVTEENITKPWNIKFSKKLDQKTLSELVIIVHDEQNNLIETTATYDADKTVTITPLQPYKSGGTYTLYIGKELSSADGEGLKNSVKMKFTIK